MERVKWVDFGRGITIFFVLMGHCISNLYVSHQFSQFDLISKIMMTFIFTFIMPCFFALSGFLYKSPRSIGQYLMKLKKKFIGLVIPYIIFSVVYVLLQQFAKTDVNKLYSWGSLLKIWYKPIAYLWFLYILFFVFLIVGIFDLLKISQYAQGIIFVILFLSSQIIINSSMISQIFSWIPCFYVGILIKNNMEILKKRNVFIISLILMLLGIYLQYLLRADWFNPNGMSLLTFFSKIMSIFVFFFLFANINRGKIFNYFKSYGRYSMVIYLVHVPIKSFFKMILFKLGINNYFIFLILLIILTWEASIFVCKLTDKFKTKITRTS